MIKKYVQRLVDADLLNVTKHAVDFLTKLAHSSSRQGVVYVLLNLVMTLCSVALVDIFAVKVESNSFLDEIVEAANSTMHFLLFTLIAFIHIKNATKIKLLIGFFFTQLGLLLDFLDEIYDLNTNWWHLIGDVIYLFGGLCLITGAVQWVVYTYHQAILDPLTKVYNRRYFEQCLATQLARIQRHKSEAILVSLDLDNFKHVNDKFGHSVGDDVLKLVADVLKRTTRRSDVICRSGGEEFELLLVDTNTEQAVVMVKRIQASLRSETPSSLDTITASIGITEVRESDSVESVRKRADSAMYSAKKSGKDKVVTAV